MSNPIYGNYHGYYTKRPFLRDPRLALLPVHFFLNKSVLDVGCNEGWVTCEIAQSWGARHVLGVDIDDALVRAAWKRRRTLWSLQAPRIASDTDTDADHFPSSCAHHHGLLPIPASDHTAFPHNIAFRTTDWVTEHSESVADDESTVRRRPRVRPPRTSSLATDLTHPVRFSITKWIHLHHGDDGLHAFFKRVYRVLNAGGAFLVEPQAWETYAKARRMDPRLRENAKGLRLRPDEFPGVLEQIGFAPPQRLGTVGEGGFHRPVDLYIKK
ncbi:Bicoid-interacting protein 3-domain-containing protein [Chiua virens]|nr:Bicoid-interacting protein 3-domain-containing protein [Chiua virens]